MMKYLKTYKIFENSKVNTELINRLEYYHIKNYTINEDGTIDVDDNVYISMLSLKKIPFNFGKVTGYFNCSNNKLESLEGCPKEVGERFDCSDNELVSLIGGPEYIDGDYYCRSNKLETLEGCAGDVGGDLDCCYNNLTSLDCSSVIGGDIYSYSNNFEEEPEFFGICGGKIFWK